MEKSELRVPDSQKKIAAAAAAALLAAANNSPRTFVKFTRTKRIKKRNQQESRIWLVSPGTIQFLRTAQDGLIDNGKSHRHLNDQGEVVKIAIGNYPDDPDTVFIWVTEPSDPDGFTVKKVNGQWECNVADFFMGSGLSRPVGVKEKFELVPGPEDHAEAPVLVFHLNKPQERRTFSTTSKKSDKK